MLSRPTNKLLFIAHLAERIGEFERGARPMHATAYRLLARRLRQATAGASPAMLIETLAPRHPALLETVASRHFDDHGHFGSGRHAARAREFAAALFARLDAGA